MSSLGRRDRSDRAPRPRPAAERPDHASLLSREALLTQHDVPEGSRSQPSDQQAIVRRNRVVQIIAMVKPFRAQAVLAALEGVDVLAGTVREAMGYGRQKDRLHQYLGSEYNSSFVPKVELAVFVHEQDATAAIKAIVGQAVQAGSATAKSSSSRATTST